MAVLICRQIVTCNTTFERLGSRLGFNDSANTAIPAMVIVMILEQ